jgi:hypothetical protein
VLAIVAGTLGVIQAGYNPVTQLMSELGETGAPYALHHECWIRDDRAPDGPVLL